MTTMIYENPSRVENLEEHIRSRLKTGSGGEQIVVLRNMTSIGTDSPLSGFEYTNLIGQIGRVWTTHDELRAESDHQLANHSAIIQIRSDGLLGSRALPPHADAAHHPARPYPARSLQAIKLPGNTSGQTKWFCTIQLADIMGDSLMREFRTYKIRHTPAYGTGWSHRWGRMVELDPFTGREYLAFDPVFTKEIVGPDGPIGETHFGLIKMTIMENLPECLVYTHVWQPNDIVIWNNRTSLHARTPIEGERVMRRITFDLI